MLHPLQASYIQAKNLDIDSYVDMALDEDDLELMDMAQPLLDPNEDIQFDLYTLENPIEPQILRINDTQSFENSNFDRRRPTRIFAHGFQSRGQIKDYLTQGISSIFHVEKYCH